MGTNAKIRIYPASFYLLKVSNENCRKRCVICSKLTKKTPEQPHWHEDIKKHWCPSGVSIPFLTILFMNFEKCCQLVLPVEIKVQTSKNYETCKDRWKLSHINQTDQTITWKEPVSGMDPEILKRGGTLCRPPWLVDKENFRFQMV